MENGQMSASVGVRYGLLGISVAVCFAAAGCQTISPSLDGLMGVVGATNVESAEAAETNAAPTYIVEYRREGGPPTAKQLPLRDGMCVQDALNESGATKRLSRMEVLLMRTLPNGGQHRMGIQFKGSKRVRSEFNYALHPGDRIVVQKDDGNLLDDTLNSVLGPLGINFRG
jgi:hypothetical protein